MNLRSISGVDVSGKRVLLRAGLNVPIAGEENLADDFRLRAALRTMQYLAGRGAKTVIVAHLGRDGESLQPVASALKRAAPALPLQFFGGSIADAPVQAAALKDGECLLLENIRREAGEEENDPALAQKLAALGELFVNDAFADSHRAHASVVGVAKLLPSYAGLLMVEEVARLGEALAPASPSLAIIAGAKFETKRPLIEKLLPLYGRICVGGAIANDFLHARGLEVGKSLVSEVPVPPELAHDPRILVQSDTVVSDGGTTRTCSVTDIHADETIVDAGEETAQAWSAEIRRAQFVLWNGPLGVYEKGFTQATDALANALAGASCRAAVGGGDTLAAIEKISLPDDRIFRSTGGGAMLQFLADGTLVGIELLKS